MADQWDFVTAAYVLTALATLAIVAWSWGAMRAAEAADRSDAERDA